MSDRPVDSPYADAPADAAWLRGNLHTHTAASPDADRPVEAVLADYADRGDDFLAITDHDVAFDPAPYRDETGLILLPGVEVTANGPHVLRLGSAAPATPHPDRRRVLADAVAADAATVLAHPNWGPTFDHYDQPTLEALEGYAGLEVYNGATRGGEGSADATDRWDRLLAAGRVVWGYGTDDAHRPADVGRAWTAVLTAESTPAGVLDALRTGRCYASTGPTIRDVAVDGTRVTVETAAAGAIRLVTDHGAVARTLAGPTATVDLADALDDDAGYARFEALGEAGRRAWTQPLFLDGRR